MSGETPQHPWGVPADAPPPRPRSSWGSTDKPAAPAARDTGAAETTAPETDLPVGEPAWKPAPGEDIDLAAFHAGAPDRDGDFDPFAAAPDDEPAEEEVPAGPESELDAEAGEEQDRGADTAVTESAPDTMEEPTMADEPTQHAAEEIPGDPFAAADQEAGDDSLADLFGAPGDGHDHLPDLPVAPSDTPASDAGESAAVTNLPDLFGSADDAQSVPAEGSLADALFDQPDAEAAWQDQLPEEAGQRNVPATLDESPSAAPAPYQSTSEAMTAWHAMRQAAAPAAPSVDRAATMMADQALANRYASYERLSGLVDRVLGLAQSGNPHMQGVINNFQLTRDHAADAQQRAAYEAVMVPAMAENMVTVDNPMDVHTVLDLAYDELIGIGPLGPLWRDDAVTEILVSGPEKVVCERDGALVVTPVRFRNLEHLRKIARDLAQRVDDRVVSRSTPLVTAQLPGARVQFALAPIAPVAGVSITIRKFRPLFGIDDLLAFGAMTEEMAAFLSDTIQARANVLVSGGTGSGKTTMINAMSSFIPDSERVITIEDALELALTNTHVESLVTKEAASGDDQIVIPQDDLLRASLRMRPDRIIVGEIRDGAGCATMLQAANTGHDGTMTTVHANDPRSALRRLGGLLRSTSESMSAELAAEEVRMAFDVIVQVVRTRNRRFVSAISLVNKDRDEVTHMFTGTFSRGDENPRFNRVGSLSSDTDMARRFEDAGLDPTLWGATAS